MNTCVRALQHNTPGSLLPTPLTFFQQYVLLKVLIRAREDWTFPLETVMLCCVSKLENVNDVTCVVLVMLLRHLLCMT